jgi:hypothetical protein
MATILLPAGTVKRTNSLYTFEGMDGVGNIGQAWYPILHFIWNEEGKNLGVYWRR